MALSARNVLTAVAGLIVLGFAARKIQQRYDASRKPTPRLVSDPDFEPREQSPRDEHLHVSLGEFLQGRQLQVG